MFHLLLLVLFFFALTVDLTDFTFEGAAAGKASPYDHSHSYSHQADSANQGRKRRSISTHHTSVAGIADAERSPETRPRNHRPATAAGRNAYASADSPCLLSKMYVDFENIGWSSWIIFPKGRDCNYHRCSFLLT